MVELDQINEVANVLVISTWNGSGVKVLRILDVRSIAVASRSRQSEK